LGTFRDYQFEIDAVSLVEITFAEIAFALFPIIPIVKIVGG
jgi:nitrate reductase NapE component